MRSKKNSVSIKKTDGRKNNGRKSGQVVKKQQPKTLATTTGSRLNKAKKDRISIYALNAMKEVFGSEQEAWQSLAEQAKDSFAHMNLLWQHRYGKPSEAKSDDGNKKLNVPVINFYANTNQVEQLDNTIDITPEDE